MESEERMKSWEELKLCEQVPWETWKVILRSVNHDTQKAQEKWEKINKKIARKKQKELDKILFKV
jgi:hypothetical protein